MTDEVLAAAGVHTLAKPFPWEALREALRVAVEGGLERGIKPGQAFIRWDYIYFAHGGLVVGGVGIDPTTSAL